MDCDICKKATKLVCCSSCVDDYMETIKTLLEKITTLKIENEALYKVINILTNNLNYVEIDNEE